MTSDEFAGQRLSDIPNAGYQTHREKQTSDAIMIFLRHLERNRPLLLLIVCEGLDVWKQRAGREWRGLLIDDELLMKTFAWLVEVAGPNPKQQLENLIRLQQLTPIEKVWGSGR